MDGKQTWCLTSTETVRLIRDGEMGYMEGGGGIIHLSLHCHHQNDSCIKMGIDGSHFNVSLITVRDKVKDKRRKGEPKRIRTEVPLLTDLTSHR